MEDTKNSNTLAKFSKAILDVLLTPSPDPTLFRVEIGINLPNNWE